MADRVLAFDGVCKCYGDVATRIYAPAMVRGGTRLSWADVVRLPSR